MSAPILAIINGQAGGVADAEARSELSGLLEAALPGIRVLFTDKTTDVTATARQAVQAGSRMVVAGGGDGTINAVATALAGTDTRLGVLPNGTLNHFAKDLLIPLDLADAIRTLAQGHVMAVDVGDVNGRIFVNNSGLGLYPAIVALREARQRKGMTKWPALAWATVKVLRRYARLTIHITVEGQELVRSTPVIFVGNNEYAVEGLRVGTRERLDQGQLCLYIPNHQGPLGLLWFSLRALLGVRERHGEFDRFLSSGFRIEAGERELIASIDGEVMRIATPLRYRIRPGDLTVVVPLPKP